MYIYICICMYIYIYVIYIYIYIYISYEQIFYIYIHCVKSVHIQSYSGPHFLAFGLNAERYSISLCIYSK